MMKDKSTAESKNKILWPVTGFRDCLSIVKLPSTRDSSYFYAMYLVINPTNRLKVKANYSIELHPNQGKSLKRPK